jgi:hypothetical protein
VLLTVVGGVAAVGVASRERKSLGSGGGDSKALPAGSGDKLLERTVRDLRVNDVLTIDGKDFICEGLVSYDEDGHRWSAGRCADGSNAAHDRQYDEQDPDHGADYLRIRCDKPAAVGDARHEHHRSGS